MVTQCIKTGKRIYTMQDGVRWLADVAKGLQYLHESIPKVGAKMCGRRRQGNVQQEYSLGTRS